MRHKSDKDFRSGNKIGQTDTKRKEKNREENRKQRQLMPGGPRSKRNLPEMEEKLRERKSRK
jgi:hypothetical protein